ncbi:alpha-beta hydrolase superfamily lysophospholipase [Mumia flava]|uniref:Alpha-beta hydrolase superfamily lysophospholipase n=1 Tax=Mumia flava TaxID=1348852 RepID=A0A0B2B393_9ACTN|nr:alpha/beta hydrolase [Mumia flava]PJJ57884.1 alpha-beta hydrolase superfamily lysophospholipase [Mumia flava]
METPRWFTEAIGHQPEHHTVESGGATITYRVWGRPDAPLVVLVHGGAAHAGWWDHVGPHLAADHRVAALDLSGHGDSSWRDAYGLTTFAAEVMAVADAESVRRPAIVGHSMGGFVALTAAREYGARLAGVCAIDSPVRQPSPEARAWQAENRRLPGNKIYPTRDDALARFRTIPADDAGPPYVRRHIAATSVREVEGGWTWKFDPQVFFSARMEPEEIAAATCPVALVRGERGLATSDITATVAERLGGAAPVTVIPDAGHHVMIDQPVALIAAMQTLLGQWQLLRRLAAVPEDEPPRGV